MRVELSRPGSAQAPDRATSALRIGVGALLLLLSTTSGIDTGEGRNAYNYARYIVQHQRLALPEKPPGLYQRSPSGEYYPAHEFLNAAVMVPMIVTGDALGRALSWPPGWREYGTRILVILLPCVYIALCAAAVYQIVRWGLGLSARTAAATALATTFGTMLWPYSRMTVDSVLATMLLTWSVALEARAIEEPGRAEWRLLAAGACVGAAIASRISAVVALPVLGAWCLTVESGRRPKAFAALVAGAFPFLIWQTFYNAWRSGSPWVPAVAMRVYAPANTWSGDPLGGVMGLLFSPGKSTFIYAPLILLALVGVPAMARRRRALTLVIGVIAGATLVLHGSVVHWSGDWTWGPRYMLPLIPLACVPSAYLLENGKRAVRVFVVIAVLLQLPALIINWEYRYLFLFQETRTIPALWSLSNSQYVDAVQVAARNVRRTFGEPLPPDVVRTAHPLNVHASNHLNMWWASMPAVGVPAWATVPIAITLAGAGFCCVRGSRRRRTSS